MHCVCTMLTTRQSYNNTLIHCNMKRKRKKMEGVFMRDLARWAEVHRITLWRWLRPHRARLIDMGYVPGKPLPEKVVDFICDWFVIYATF